MSAMEHFPNPTGSEDLVERSRLAWLICGSRDVKFEEIVFADVFPLE